MAKPRPELTFPIHLPVGLHRFENFGCRFAIRVHDGAKLSESFRALFEKQYIIGWHDLFEPHWSMTITGDVDRLKVALQLKGLLD